MNIGTTKIFKFCAAHRLPDVEKCCNIHGHNYTIHVCVKDDINENDMVMNFSDMSIVFKSWIDKYLDHSLILHSSDELIDKLSDCTKIVILSTIPTVENLARYLMCEFEDLLNKMYYNKNIYVYSIKLYETDTCYVELFS